MAVLAEGLRNNTVLEHLDLRANNIRDAGVVSLAENLVANSSSSLQKLFLFGNPFGEAGSQALLQAIPGNLELTVLNMDYHSCLYDRIQYYVCLNQSGRKVLRDESLNPALWPLIFEKASRVSRNSRGICTETDLIFPWIQQRGSTILLLS